MNTTLSRDYWTFDDDAAEVKFFTHKFCPCTCLANLFDVPISRKQLVSLRNLADPYRNLLEKASDQDSIPAPTIDALVSGWLKRVDHFES